mmetsp:Transcript_42172/g.70152  ORF Transcript_42172/g.70152 Transcript_42172/m.70152 type:complete len:179 (-) Transcript_42172:64-600(-)
MKRSMKCWMKSWQIVAALRVVNGAWGEEKMLHNALGGQLISVANEERWNDALLNAIKKRLSRCGLSEDAEAEDIARSQGITSIGSRSWFARLSRRSEELLLKQVLTELHSKIAARTRVEADTKVKVTTEAVKSFHVVDPHGGSHLTTHAVDPQGHQTRGKEGRRSRSRRRRNKHVDPV